MRYLLILLLVMMIVSPVSAYTLERDSEIVFDGRIDLLSLAGNGDSEVVVKVKGKGKGKITSDTLVEGEFLQQEAQVEVKSHDFSGIAATIGARIGDNMYVQKVEPRIGQSAYLEHELEAKYDTFAALTYGSLMEITDGLYKRHIELSAEDISLSEILKIVGTGATKDHIRFAPEEDEDD